jgi:putative addiction module killer protein
MIELKYYVDTLGRSPFADWFDGLDKIAGREVAISLNRMERGNLSNVKAVGEGVFERKIHFGPGYRVYFGRDGDQIVILLAGGTKKRQQRDIEGAKKKWQDYKKRK